MSLFVAQVGVFVVLALVVLSGFALWSLVQSEREAERSAPMSRDDAERAARRDTAGGRGGTADGDEADEDGWGGDDD